MSSLWSLLSYYGRNFGTPDCNACGLCWACRGQNFGSPDQDRKVLVFNGPATDEILELLFVRFVVLARPPRRPVWNSGCRFVALAGPATDKILEVQLVRFVVFSGLATGRICCLAGHLSIPCWWLCQPCCWLAGWPAGLAALPASLCLSFFRTCSGCFWGILLMMYIPQNILIGLHFFFHELDIRLL